MRGAIASLDDDDDDDDSDWTCGAGCVHSIAEVTLSPPIGH